MYKEWLKNKTTVAEAEAEHMVDLVYEPGSPMHGPTHIAFGNANARWLALVAKMQEGDELWTFDSPLETWENLCGRRGYSIVRDGEIIDSLIIGMN